jgi:hypothetical protein
VDEFREKNCKKRLYLSWPNYKFILIIWCS